MGIGILALGEIHVLAIIQRVAGTSPGAATLVAGVGFVLVCCLVLKALQFWCTGVQGLQLLTLSNGRFLSSPGHPFRQRTGNSWSS